jgi:hypothetical protein
VAFQTCQEVVVQKEKLASLGQPSVEFVHVNNPIPRVSGNRISCFRGGIRASNPALRTVAPKLFEQEIFPTPCRSRSGLPGAFLWTTRSRAKIPRAIMRRIPAQNVRIAVPGAKHRRLLRCTRLIIWIQKKLPWPAVGLDGWTIFVADAHRGDGKRFVVRADEKLMAFVELETASRR